jgi:subtilisin family serine protease
LTADDIPVHGAAPQAKIMAYKVLTAVGSGTAASIIAAIEDAVQPRTITGQPKPVAHVINLSLGGAGNADSPNSVACDNAALAGAIVVASAGNSGPGEATIGQPASSRRAITVGANIDPGSGPNSVDVVGEGRTDMRAYLLAGSADILSDITNNYVFCGLAESPDQVPDSVSGKIALIERGSTVTVGDPVNAGTGLASNKVAFAAAKGAIAAIIFNNVDGEITNLTVRKSTIPSFGMNRDNGLYLKSLIGAEEFGAISAKQIRIKKAQLFDPAMAEFSSRGPVAGYGQVKPDVTAPGVSVLSATVAVGGVQTNTGYMFDPSRYISASGTSMSSPMTAGIVALIRQKNPNWTPSMVRAALVNTSTNLRQADGTPVADGANTINEQGGGLVDAYSAANAKALMGVGVLGPNGTAAGRSYGICSVVTGGAINQLCYGASNPDFTPSYSFGEVPIANVIGTATISQTVTINDITSGGGAATYQLAVSNVRGVDQDGFRVSITDTNGNPISSITVPVGGSASFNVKTVVNGEKIANPTQAQWYVSATRDFTRTPMPGLNLRMPFYYRAVRPNLTLAAPSLAQANGTEVSGSPVIDINGNYSLSYSFAGAPAPAKFRIEEQKDNGAWTQLADVDAGQTSFDISGRGNGAYNYRVAGLFPVEHGLLPGPASEAQTVQVNRRLESDVTALVQTAISNVSLAGGAFEFDQTLKNTSADKTILPPLKFTINSIQSNSNTVRVTNADNGGNGMETAATFDYSSTVGADRALVPGETSGARHLKFSNQAGELFQFTATVKGHFPDPAFGTSSVAKSSESKRFKVRIVFIADPQTGTVSIAGIE